MSDLTDMLVLLDPDKPEPCNGLIFRCSISGWKTDNTINFKQSYRLLKRKSCPGCDSCEYLWDEVDEFLNYGSGIIADGEDGKMYRLAVVNETRDWESGIVDGYDLKFVEYYED